MHGVGHGREPTGQLFSGRQVRKKNHKSLLLASACCIPGCCDDLACTIDVSYTVSGVR